MVSRYEYEGVCLRLAEAEAQIKRCRTALDTQLRRIAQLQVELTALERAQSRVARPVVEVASPQADIPSDASSAIDRL